MGVGCTDRVPVAAPRGSSWTVLHALRWALPLELGPVYLMLVVNQIVWFVIIHIANTRALPLTPKNVSLLLYSFFTMLVLTQLISSITSWSRVLRVLGGLLLVFCYVNLFGYHVTTRTGLDYSVAADNIGNSGSPGSGLLVLKACGIPAMAVSAALVILLLVLERKWRILSRTVQRPPLWPKIASSAGLYLGVLLAPWTTYDDVTYFWKSGFDYYRPSSLYKVDHRPGTYPFVHNRGRRVADLPPGPRPDIVLLSIESFNADVVGRRGPNGAELTPVFNRAIDRGVYVERFYGNSVQTCKGLFATLFSLVPSYRTKVFTSYFDVRFRALPALLREAGYETIFFQAYEDLDFDRTRDFLHKNGFETVESLESHMTPGDKKLVWGWGPEDQVLYRRFFDHLGRRPAGQRPLFVHLVTVANHMDFSEVPPSKRAFYPRPRKRSESYANSVHLSDAQLALFFERLGRSRLRDALVIITSDHAMPVGRHGLLHNETGLYDDSFRVPLLMIWPGHLAPRRVTGRAHSQMDIAPTVLALLGLSGVQNHFQGTPIVGARPAAQHPIYLVQPYSGRYLEVVRYPYKLIFHDRTKEEMLFNLAKDPDERDDLIEGAPIALLRGLRRDLGFVFLNQHLLERDAFYPR